MVTAPWLSSLRWPQRRTVLWELCGRAPVRYLAEAGLQVLERNWRCPLGEIDLVAREGNETVFVEVKTRAGLGYGHPFEAITGAPHAIASSGW